MTIQIEMCRGRAQQYMTLKNIPEADAKILVYEDEGFSGKNTARNFKKCWRRLKLAKLTVLFATS